MTGCESLTLNISTKEVDIEVKVEFIMSIKRNVKKQSKNRKSFFYDDLLKKKLFIKFLYSNS